VTCEIYLWLNVVVQRMKAIQPDGAIRLAGYSFGACVAIEMALQLQQQADVTVESLVLLDGSHSFATYLDNSKERMMLSGFTADVNVIIILSFLMFAFRFTSSEVCLYYTGCFFKPFDARCCHMGTATKHPPALFRVVICNF